MENKGRVHWQCTVAARCQLILNRMNKEAPKNTNMSYELAKEFSWRERLEKSRKPQGKKTADRMLRSAFLTDGSERGCLTECGTPMMVV